MPGITVHFPTDEEEDLLRRFTVNRNYLQAIAGFITTTYGRHEKLYSGLKSTVEGLPQYQKINKGPADVAEVRRFLSLAWTSEIQLHLSVVLAGAGWSARNETADLAIAYGGRVYSERSLDRLAEEVQSAAQPTTAAGGSR